MKKLILLGGIGLAIVVILVVWTLIAGLGLVSEKLPHWMSAAEKVAGVAIGKAKEALPGIQEKAGKVSPEITERVKGLISGDEIPEKDVGGEDIAGIPRVPNMVRVSFDISNGKRTIGYKGKIDLGTVTDFYNKEMSALSFKKKVLSASTHDEVHEYKKAKKALEFSFKKTDRLRIAMTEMVIREL
ncbi:MAG: hypothetical protein KJ739_09525 [Nitrospinae bacterium]|nr:hypothetical protein [Nitrospinota bacterium]